MANEMPTRMMRQQAAKDDQILKNSLPISIPLPGPPSSCTAPVERAIKLNPERSTKPGEGSRQCLAESKPRRSAPAVATKTLPHITEAIMITERDYGRHPVSTYNPRSSACRPGCRSLSVGERDQQDGAKNESDGDEERHIDDFWERTDRIADRQFVLSLVEQLRQRVGYGEEDCPVKRAGQIEKAALKVSQLARAFAEEMQRSDGPPVVPSVLDRVLH